MAASAAFMRVRYAATISASTGTTTEAERGASDFLRIDGPAMPAQSAVSRAEQGDGRHIVACVRARLHEEAERRACPRALTCQSGVVDGRSPHLQTRISVAATSASSADNSLRKPVAERSTLPAAIPQDAEKPSPKEHKRCGFWHCIYIRNGRGGDVGVVERERHALRYQRRTQREAADSRRVRDRRRRFRSTFLRRRLRECRLHPCKRR